MSHSSLGSSTSTTQRKRPARKAAEALTCRNAGRKRYCARSVCARCERQKKLEEEAALPTTPPTVERLAVSLQQSRGARTPMSTTAIAGSSAGRVSGTSNRRSRKNRQVAPCRVPHDCCARFERCLKRLLPMIMKRMCCSVKGVDVSVCTSSRGSVSCVPGTLHTVRGPQSAQSVPNVHIRVGAGSSLSVLQQYAGTGRYFANALTRLALDGAYGGDLPTLDGDVSDEGRAAGAVDDGSTSNDQIEHFGLLNSIERETRPGQTGIAT